jgi:four helix bundle protein
LAESSRNGNRRLPRYSDFPKRRNLWPQQQLRRSAVSVASNIAEGQGRLSKREFSQFLGQARGSLIEMETQVLIGAILGYVPQDTLARLMTVSGEVSRLLHGLMQSIQPQEPPTRN